MITTGRRAVAVDLGGLAKAARHALGSEAFVVVAQRASAPAVVADHSGLSLAEVAMLTERLGERPETLLEREFGRVLSADVALGAERLGSVHALRRAGGSFQNEDLIGTFASQTALALALHGRAPLPGDQELLGDLDRLVLSVHDLEQLSEAVQAAVGPVFGGAQTGVMLADPQRSVLQMAPGAFGADDELATSLRVSIYDARSNSARVFSTGQPYLTNLSSVDPGIRQDSVSVFGVARLVSVPLERLGVLHIANKPTDFTLEDVERAQAIAPRLASIVEIATTLLRLRRQQRVDEMLADVAVAVASGAKLDSFLRPTVEGLCSATDANLLAVVPDDDDALAVRRGDCPSDLEAVVLDEAGDDPGIRAYVVGPDKAGDRGWAAFYVPIRLGGDRFGTLAALRVRGEPFAEVERRALARFADLVALARATQRFQQQRADLARLQERQRIADDLHDDVAQILFAAQLSLDALLQNPRLEEDAVAAITRARGLLIRGDTAIRTVIHRLSSPPAADIATRVAAVVATVEDEFSVPIEVHIGGEVARIAHDLPRPVTDALVKVARESLVNAAKHAGPCMVDLRLEISRAGRLVLTVADDGRDTPVPRGEHHHGLASMRRIMRELGGLLRISCGAGGTRVSASVPLDAV